MECSECRLINYNKSLQMNVSIRIEMNAVAKYGNVATVCFRKKNNGIDMVMYMVLVKKYIFSTVELLSNIPHSNPLHLSFETHFPFEIFFLKQVSKELFICS